MGERLTRLRGSAALGVAVVVQRLRDTAPRRIVYSVLGVVLAVGLFVLVAGVSIGLATESAAVGSNADYWIVPESESSATLPVSVGGPQLGSVHDVAAQLGARDDVRYASPVAVTLAELSRGNTTEYVLVFGVVAHPELTAGGLSAAPLTPGDPHYANGTYGGPKTNEMVISSGTAQLLETSADETVLFGAPDGPGREPRRMTVINVSAGSTPGFDSVPVALVHLSELQAIMGDTDRDSADQMVVAADSTAVRDDLETIYERTEVVTRSSTAGVGSDADLALAVGGAGLVVSLVVGSLFVATTIGLEIRRDRRLWVTLSALGFSAHSRVLVIISQTGVITLAGGVIGIGIGRVAIAVTNAGISRYIDEATVAVFRLDVALAALAVSAGIAALTGPYLLWLTSRGTAKADLIA
ncbi:ABC transporter permease [Halorubrum ezzemoulense]|uniref:ABC transporter permease n=1 Tax=Halorubrum ezzemoulense TaxID=337243 RepID=UPI00232C3A83|nr:ABC transporter permease [Halorubrum ezzemoulense]MDB2262083.1 ABC transporter permease [Halorubrum ezzemoulense]MDB2268930.1 ABC transporter permease [Halorubrum ezzemoulense]